VYKPHYREVTRFLFGIIYTDYQKTICLTNLKKKSEENDVSVVHFRRKRKLFLKTSVKGMFLGSATEEETQFA
jgi:hypothetical protein